MENNLVTEIRDQKSKPKKPITAYGPKLRVQLKFPEGEGRTKRSFKDECDINVIMRRYAQTGVIEHVSRREPVYADVTGHDYQTAMDVLANARTAFAELPARIRDRFDNDPQKMLEFVHNDDNLAEARELGLLSPEAVKRMDDEAMEATRLAEEKVRQARQEEPGELGEPKAKPKPAAKKDAS